MLLDASENQISDFRPIQRSLQVSTLKESIKMLNVSGNTLVQINISDIPGLFSLDLSYNPNLSEVILSNLPNIRMIDLRQCKIDDVALLNMLECDVFPKNIRLAGNQITDLGIQALIENKQLQNKLMNLTSLELKNTLTAKYTMISQVIKELPQSAQTQKRQLSSLKPADNNSRFNSAKSMSNSTALGQIKKTVNQYLEQLEQTHQNAIKRQKMNREMRKQLNEPDDDLVRDQIYAQSLIEVLVGTQYKIYKEAHEMCAKQGVCTALIAGCRLQNDLEEQIAFGFARKIGTIFCQYKKGANHDCKERCGVVLGIIQKKISDLAENDQKHKNDLTDEQIGLAIYGKQI